MEAADLAIITTVLPPLHLQPNPWSGSPADIELWGGKGQSFRLERSANLENWTLVDSGLAGTRGMIDAVDTNVLDYLRTEGRAFYRIIE